jgi:hypothetical protein
MSDNTPNPDPTNTQPQPEPLDPREARRQRREERRAARGGRNEGAWVGGIVLIILGVVFLLQDTGAFSLENWWALFILIPALGAFGRARSKYQEASGRITAGVRSSLIGGLVLTVVAAAFLFNLKWELLGPVLILLAGIALLVNALLPR